MMSPEGKLALGGLAALSVWLYAFLPWIYSSKPPVLTEVVPVVAAVAAALSAVFSAVSARANVYNTRTFERQLRNSTIDACIAAAIGLRGAINRALRIKAESAGDFAAPDLWAAYTRGLEQVGCVCPDFYGRETIC